MKAMGLRKDIRSLAGRCGWGIPEELCTAEELSLRLQYVALSTQYYVLLGLVPKQIDFTEN